MKILVLVACVLAIATTSDALFKRDLVIKTPSLFDIKELIDFHTSFAQCAIKVGLFNIMTTKMTYCLGQKKELIDNEGVMLWDEIMIYIKKIIRDESGLKKIEKLLKKCKKIYDTYNGNQNEKTMKALECGLPSLKYIVNQPY